MKILIIEKHGFNKYGETPSGSRKELEEDIRRQLTENGFLILGPHYSYSIVEIDEVRVKPEVNNKPYSLDYHQLSKGAVYYENLR